MTGRLPLLALAAALLPLAAGSAEAQNGFSGFGGSPFDQKFGDVKFLDAYFGTYEDKIEVEPGDSNVPFTVVFANVGSQDITGIEGQLSLPFGFSPADGSDSIIRADSNSNSDAGENFHLTFFVNVGSNAEIRQYPGTVKVDYSRLRESGVRTAFEEFTFRVTGDSVINIRAPQPFLTSLDTNNVIIEIANDGTAPISGVDIVATNTQTEMAGGTSMTNVENVVLFDSSWDIDRIGPMSTRQIPLSLYVPESLKGDTLRIPLALTYYNSHGEEHQISKIVDFYVKGLIDLSIFNVDVLDLSGTKVIVGEILNEGNEDGLFGFVSVMPRGGSNIAPSEQFIDEIEVDAPVPFNIPVEFVGEPSYGEHDITVTVRYKDGIRDELFLAHDATIFIEAPPPEREPGENPALIIIPVVAAAAVGLYAVRRRKKAKAAS